MSDGLNVFQNAPQSKKMLTLFGIYICVIFSVMQSSNLSIVLPLAAAEFDAISGTNEAMSLYSLTSSLAGPVGLILMPLWGYIGARSPHIKTKLMAASVIIGGICVLVRAFATNIWVVILTGACYGVVSAGIFVLGFVIVRDLFTGAKVGVYLGLMGTMMSIGSLVSPVLSGFLVGAFDWRAGCHMIWPFFFIGPIFILLGVNINKAQGKELANLSGSIDFLGIICTALFLGPLICGISMGNSIIPFGSPISFACFAVAVIALVALIVIIIKKKDAAVLPLSAFKDRNTVCLALSNFFMAFANMFVFFFLPTFVMMVLKPNDLGLEPAAWSGIIMASFAVAGLFLGPIFGRMIAKAGSAKLVSSLGIASRLILLLFFILLLAPGINIYLIIVMCFVFGGVYSSMTSAYSTGANIMAPARIRPQAASLVSMGQNMGGAPGTAIGGILIATFGVAQGMPIAFIVGAAACVVCFIPTLMLKKVKVED